MSIQAMAWALEQQIVKDSAARFILLVYANYAGADGTTAHPSNKTIREHTGLPERTIRRKTRLLEEAKLLLPGDQSKAVKNCDGRADRTPRCYDIPIYTRAATVAGRSKNGRPETGGRAAKTGGDGRPSSGRQSVNKPSINHGGKKPKPVDNTKALAHLKQVRELLPKPESKRPDVR